MSCNGINILYIFLHLLGCRLGLIMTLFLLLILRSVDQFNCLKESRKYRFFIILCGWPRTRQRIKFHTILFEEIINKKNYFVTKKAMRLLPFYFKVYDTCIDLINVHRAFNLNDCLALLQSYIYNYCDNGIVYNSLIREVHIKLHFW